MLLFRIKSKVVNFTITTTVEDRGDTLQLVNVKLPWWFSFNNLLTWLIRKMTRCCCASADVTWCDVPFAAYFTHIVHYEHSQSSAQLSQSEILLMKMTTRLSHSERDSSSRIQIREQDCTSTKASHHTTITKMPRIRKLSPLFFKFLCKYLVHWIFLAKKSDFPLVNSDMFVREESSLSDYTTWVYK